MGHKTYFHIKQTGRNLRHNWPTQLMTVMTISLSVLIFSFFLLIYLNIVNAGNRLGDELRLIVYLNEEVAPEVKQMYENKIREFGKVERIEFISRAEAFARLGRQLDTEKDVLADLGPDFLPPSIEVYPRRSMRNLTSLKQFSDYLTTLPAAQKVQYGRSWVERFGYFIELLRVIVILSGVLLVMATVFMVSYTIRLTVVAKEEELAVLRLVGADNKFIQTPLLIEGVLQGVIGSACGILLLYLIFRWTTGHLSGPGFLNMLDFAFFPPKTTAIIAGTSVLLCAGGSLISIRKFMRI
ncbi:MAG: permease-like cell division protein FtsX [Desulfurivibrionaceae bacterium]|nr:permease-like cell division protein FtsX [Desulfobulbales bacterium]MDT8335654.1 permease-like cell division protein FtsX [Desulfurivibrionaceae bacterium]